MGKSLERGNKKGRRVVCVPPIILEFLGSSIKSVAPISLPLVLLCINFLVDMVLKALAI